MSSFVDTSVHRQATAVLLELMDTRMPGMDGLEATRHIVYISPATARTYISRLLAKLNARDRSQLIIIAYESGLVTPGQT